MAPRDTSIAIIGGGIGGLTAAVSLLQAGFDVQVYEQSRLLSEVGAGINIGPNAARLLIQLGLGEECAKVAYRSPFFHQRRWDDGRTLTKTPLGEAIAKEFGAPHMIFHRGELHALLAKAVPTERVHLAHRCINVEQNTDGVTATFENGVKALLAHIHGDPALARMRPPLAPFSAGDRAAAVAGYDQVRGKRVA